MANTSVYPEGGSSSPARWRAERPGAPTTRFAGSSPVDGWTERSATVGGSGRICRGATGCTATTRCTGSASMPSGESWSSGRQAARVAQGSSASFPRSSVAAVGAPAVRIVVSARPMVSRWDRPCRHGRDTRGRRGSPNRRSTPAPRRRRRRSRLRRRRPPPRRRSRTASRSGGSGGRSAPPRDPTRTACATAALGYGGGLIPPSLLEPGVS